MRLLRYKLLPIFRRNRGISLLICIVSALGILVMVALSGLSRSLDASVDKYYETECIMPDAVYILDTPVLSSALPSDGRIGEMSGLMLYPAEGRSPSGRRLSFMVAAKGDDVLWQDVTQEESPVWAAENGGISVEISSEFAARNSLELGDTLSLTVGGETREVTVDRIIAHVSMFSVERDANTMYGSTEYGMLYMSRSALEELYGLPQGVVNCLQVNFAENASADASAEVRQVLEAAGIEVGEAAVTENAGVFEKILSPIEQLTTVVPMIFLGIMLLMIFILLHTIIRADREQIGILRALGYSASAVRLLYCAYILIMTLIASALSVFAGYGVVALITRLFSSSYGLPWVRTLDGTMSALAAVLTIVTGQIAVFACMSAIRKIQPAEAMRKGNLSAAKLSEATGKLLSRFGNLLKLMFSAALRNRTRFAVSAVILFATALLINLALSIYTARNYIYTDFHPLRFGYDSMAVFEGGADDATLAAVGGLEEVERCERFSMLFGRVEYGSNSVALHIIGVQPDAQLVSVYDMSGGKIAPTDVGAVLSINDAERLGCGVGDVITVNGQDVTVTELSKNARLGTVYCTEDVFERLCDGRDATDAVAIKMRGEVTQESENRLADRLAELEGYDYSLYSRIQRHEITYSVGAYDYGIAVVLIIAILLGFAVIYVMSLIDLSDREPDYGILRALGVRIGTIAAAAYTESLVKYVLAMAAAVLVGLPTNKLMLGFISTDVLYLHLTGYVPVCLVTAAIVLLYVTLAHFLAIRKIRRLNLTDVMKARD